jgi:TRAP-type C4-dicarboxylate transport system permease large subunit
VIIILAMGHRTVRPAVRSRLLCGCAIGRVDPAERIRPIWGYRLALLVGLIVVAIFPWMSIGFL